MSDCIIEQLVTNVVTTLQGITTLGGYANNVTPSDVVRPNPGLGTAVKNLSLIVVQGNPIRQSAEPQAGIEWLFPIQIICTVVESESSSTAVDSRLNSIRADVEKILMVDYHRGNLAINTEVEDPDYAPIELNAHVGAVTVNVNLRFRTRFNDPYTLQ